MRKNFASKFNKFCIFLLKAKDVVGGAIVSALLTWNALTADEVSLKVFFTVLAVIFASPLLVILYFSLLQLKDKIIDSMFRSHMTDEYDQRREDGDDDTWKL